MKFDMTKPCEDCPFRSNKPFYLAPRRAREIADALRRDQSFTCHKTIDYGAAENSEGETDLEHRPYDPSEQHCAGATIVLWRMGAPNQWMRLAGRLGLFDPGKLDMQAPVYEDLDAFVDAIEELDRGTRRACVNMEKKAVRTHYAGEIFTATSHTLPGWAACCSGDRARKIRADGAHSVVAADVDCKRCLARIKSDKAWRAKRAQEGKNP